MALYSLLLIGSLLSSAFCMPAPRSTPRFGLPPPPKHPGHILTVQELQTSQPLNGLVSNSNVTLQFAGLGVGVQNYSCASITSAPKSVGAVATLFDVTEFLQRSGDMSSDLSTQYLKAYEKKACILDAANLSDDSCEESINALNFNVLGKHYFASINGAGVPSFNIYDGDFLSAQKVGDLLAPAGSYAGQNGAGAVDWLFLPSDGSGRSVGLSEVYRINTAGGVPVSTQCSTGVTQFSVKYAAEYWFFL